MLCYTLTMLPLDPLKHAEYREKMRLSKLGNKYGVGNKSHTGLKHTEEHKRKIGEAGKGKKMSPEAVEKIRKWHTGRKHSEETKKKISEYVKAHPVRYWKGKKLPKHVEEAKIKALTGKKLTPEERHAKSLRMPKGVDHYLWKGGVRNPDNLIRASLDYRIWRDEVFKRDNYTCVVCNERGGELEADHIKPFSLHPDLRLEVDNGRTLCHDCHVKTDTYGFKILKNRS